jgi:hypothetical protein
VCDRTHLSKRYSWRDLTLPDLQRMTDEELDAFARRCRRIIKTMEAQEADSEAEAAWRLDKNR